MYRLSQKLSEMSKHFTANDSSQVLDFIASNLHFTIFQEEISEPSL